MSVVKRFKERRGLLPPIVVVGLLVVLFVMLIFSGWYYFQNKSPDKVAGNEFMAKFKQFYLSLLYYLFHPTVSLGICAALVFFIWMLIRLFNNYFNMFKPGMFLDLVLNPKALESIPHSLLILFFYFTFLKNAESLRFILLTAFSLVSIPFIYKILEDFFIQAEKEGMIENYLVLPMPDWKLVVSFLKQKITALVVYPFMFLVLMMVYWEFLYSSIGITGDENSAPGVFYNNYNNDYLMSFSRSHNYLILLQIGIFAVAIALFLYIVYTINSDRIISPRQNNSPDHCHNIPTGDNILAACRNLTIGRALKTNAPGEEETIIANQIDLTIEKGENICIMGESGSGKTSLVREIAGILPKGLQKQSGQVYRGDNYIFSVFQDVDLYMDPYQTLYFYIKLAFKKRYRNSPDKSQGIDNSLLVRYIDEVGLLKPLLGNAEQEYNIEKIKDAIENNRQQEIENIADVLIEGLKTKTKQKLSGGEIQKFYLLVALITNPDILIADEIFTDVDSASCDKILNLLFKNRQNTTVVFISHDIGMVKRLVDEGMLHKVYYLKDKELHNDIWISPRHKINEELSMPDWAGKMWQAYRNIQDEKIVSINRGEDLPAIFEIGNVTRQFTDDKKVNFICNGKPLTIRKGVNYALVGANGTGKTTLFKILAKLSDYKGSIWQHNDRRMKLNDVSRYDCARQNQLVFQKTGNAIAAKLPIMEYLLSFFKKEEQDEAAGKINELMEKFFGAGKWRQILNRQFRELSVGEQRRILLIRALLLVNRSGILLVDEAMRGMDVFLKEKLVKYLKQTKQQILLISHDEYLVDALCERKIELIFDRETGNTIVREKHELEKKSHV